MKDTLKRMKFFAILFLLLIMSFIIWGCYHAIFEGNYFANAGFLPSAILVTLAVMIVYAILQAVKAIWKINLSILLALMIIGNGCTFSKSNQQVLVSSDCGMNWKKIAAGDAVPTGATNPCYMKVVIPNFPMQGETRFVSNLKDRVRATIHIDYDYSIDDGLAFIKQAKYLGSTNSDTDDPSNMGSKFEQAENNVIDKRLKDVVKDLLLEEDIVELDQNDLENKIHESVNKVLKQFGVQLNFITLTFDLDEQTRQAIDVATAMKIYDSKGLGDVGKQVIVSRAGATKISVEQKPSTETKE